jgi:hypothetical protein
MATVAFLWYLAVDPSYHLVNNKSKILRLNLEQHFEIIRRLLKPWTNSKISGGTAKERINRLINDAKFASIYIFFVPYKMQGAPLISYQLDFNNHHSALTGKVERGFG